MEIKVKRIYPEARLPLYEHRGEGLEQLKWYAVLFAFITILSCGILLPGIQANSIAVAFHNVYPTLTPTISGLAVTALLGLIIFGGVKRIGKTAELLVPSMAIGYVLMAVIINSATRAGRQDRAGTGEETWSATF